VRIKEWELGCCLTILTVPFLGGLPVLICIFSVSLTDRLAISTFVGNVSLAPAMEIWLYGSVPIIQGGKIDQLFFRQEGRVIGDSSENQ